MASVERIPARIVFFLTCTLSSPSTLGLGIFVSRSQARGFFRLSGCRGDGTSRGNIVRIFRKCCASEDFGDRPAWAVHLRKFLGTWTKLLARDIMSSGHSARG